MHELMQDPVVRLYTLSAGTLVLLMLITAGATGTLRLFRKAYLAPEDASFMGATELGEDPLITRLERIQRNSVENIPLFLVTGFIYALTGPSYTAAAWIFGLVTGARIAYNVVYLAGWQPWRSIIFEVGNFTHAIMVILLLINVAG